MERPADKISEMDWEELTELQRYKMDLMFKEGWAFFGFTNKGSATMTRNRGAEVRLLKR